MTDTARQPETMSGVVRRAARGRKKPMIYGRLRVIADAKTGEAIRCVQFLGAADVENIRERNFKNGDLVRMQVSKATDPHANRTLHALGKMIVENVESFQNLTGHQALKRLQVESGVHCEPISARIDGTDELAIINIPLSLSFDDTDDFEFRACAHGLAKFLVQRYWPTVKAEWVLEEMGKMVAKVESL
jgi:hypothetical protein